MNIRYYVTKRKRDEHSESETESDNLTEFWMEKTIRHVESFPRKLDK